MLSYSLPSPDSDMVSMPVYNNCISPYCSALIIILTPFLPYMLTTSEFEDMKFKLSIAIVVLNSLNRPATLCRIKQEMNTFGR